MTTIAFDGRTLAADTLVTTGGPLPGVLFAPARKIRRLPDGSFVGVAGSAAVLESVLLWMERTGGCGAVLPQCSPGQNWQVLHIDRGKAYLRTGSDPQPLEVRVPVAIGSGAAYARGAMLAGKCAVEAVRIAAIADPATGCEVETIEVAA